MIIGALVAFAAFTTTLAFADNYPPQSRPATYADSHARQVLGRVKASSDGKFFMYEWGRPYLSWIPETQRMAPYSAQRIQTFLYKVDLTRRDPTSEYLFYPNAGSTYWLGDLSPDDKHVIVFELNPEASRARAGVWSFERKSLRWFELAANVNKVEEMTAWISNDEFIYPVGNEAAPLMRASILTGQVKPCSTCTVGMMRSIHTGAAFAAMEVKAIAAYIYSRDVPREARLLAAAGNLSVAVFVRDTPDMLSLFYKKYGQPVHVVFENARR